tara:strand:+ start:1601 stop:2035 length:435 start_codon:yes stop_codon:yes gene_type:complete
MKKLIVILALINFSCNSQDDLPTPQTTTISASTTAILNVVNFEGSYDCYDWVVDEITGTTRRQTIIMSNQLDVSIWLTLNSYLLNGSYNQSITNSYTQLDSNYFDMEISPSGKSFKGFLINDTILRVTQYSGNVDFQTKDFIKE